jgi:hypothetical protein
MIGTVVTFVAGYGVSLATASRPTASRQQA